MAVYDQGIQAGSSVRLRFATDERLVGLVRRGDRTAFEVLYDRHAVQLLSFCMYMLGSRHDAEDALQTTLAAAHRTLLADERPITLRPWLFAIARNACLDILRRRRPWVEFDGEPARGSEPARGGEPPRELELREEVRQLVKGILELPERQRTALILAELNGLSQVEIATVMGVRREQVKAYAYQARSSLISEREARDSDCGDIRETLASARGAAMLRSRIRRHLRSCEGCREYRRELAGQRQVFGVLLPVAPSIGLKHSTLQDLLGGGALPAASAEGVAVGGSVAGAAVEIASGGVKVLVGKLLVGAAVAGAGASIGVSALGLSILPETPSAATSRAKPTLGRLTSFVGQANASGRLGDGSGLAGVTVLGAVTAAGGGDGASGATAPQNLPAARSNDERQTAGGAGGGGGEANGAAYQRKTASERNHRRRIERTHKTEAESQKKSEPRTRKGGQRPRSEEHSSSGEGEGREREKERARKGKEQEREKERAKKLKEQEREKARRLNEREKRRRERERAKRPGEREAREAQRQREKARSQGQRERETERSKKRREQERSKRGGTRRKEREARPPRVSP